MNNPAVIDRRLLDEVSAAAKAVPRQRKNYNFHLHDESKCHRLLNAIEPDSYIPPHRHLDVEKDETLFVVRGRLGVVFFDDGGAVTWSGILSAEGDLVGVNIPNGVFHTEASLESGTIFFESKAGPYRPLGVEERAPWAPVEGSDEAAAYLAKLRQNW